MPQSANTIQHYFLSSWNQSDIYIIGMSPLQEHYRINIKYNTREHPQIVHRLTSEYLQIDVSASMDAGCPFHEQFAVAPVCSRLWIFDTHTHSHV